MQLKLQFRQILLYSTIRQNKWFARPMSSKGQQIFTANQLYELNNHSVRLFDTQLKAKFDPLLWKVKKDLTIFQNNNDIKAKKAIRNEFYQIFASFVWPENQSVIQLTTLVKFIDCFFNFDEYHGMVKSSDSFNSIIHVIDGKQHPRQAKEILMVDILNNVSQYYSNTQLSRLTFGLRDGIMAELEAYEDEDETRYKTLADYIHNNRMYSIGIQQIINLIPYSIGVDVSKYLFDTRITELEDLVKHYAILIDDYYSFKKKIAKNDNHLQFNYMLRLFQISGDCDATFCHLQNYFREIELKFKSIKHELLISYPNETELHRYLDGLEYVCSGFYKFLLLTPRYNQFNKISINTALNDDFSDLKDEVWKLLFNYYTKMSF